MPRRKSFRKRRQKSIQRGGAPPTIDGIVAPLPNFDNTLTKYYGMVRKTRKNVGQDFDYKSHLVNQSQKDTICANVTDKEKVMIVAAGGADSFVQFYNDEAKEDLITFFEFADATDKSLDGLKINNITDINWTTFVGCT